MDLELEVLSILYFSTRLEARRAREPPVSALGAGIT